MKWSSLFIFLLGLSSCNNQTDQTSTSNDTSAVHVDHFYVDSTEQNSAGGQPYREFQSCNFDGFIADKRTPKLAKDIYLDNDWNLNKDEEALGLLDSLYAKSQGARMFYFKVVTKTYKKTDGYFSEGLGYAGKEYVEKNTKEFASYFDYKDCFTDSDLDTWANIVFLECRIDQDDIETTREEHIVYGYCRKLRAASEHFSASQKATISKFTNLLESKWGEFLKHI